MTRATENSVDCVYTIISPERLDEARRDKKPLYEKTRWVTAERLFQQGRRLAVIFADARDCSELLAWSWLTDVKVLERSTKFKVSVDGLYDVGSLKRRKLIVATTGEPIPDGHIHPNVLLKVPKLLQTLANGLLAPWKR